MDMQASPDRAVTLDPLAAQKVVEFLAAQRDLEGQPCLRLGVRGGGCSGYQYALALDEPHEDDLIFESEGQRIVISAEALPLVGGSRIVWKETFESSGFDVENPNATASCGCGSSFRVEEGASGCSEPAGPPADLHEEDAVY
jgi:iron-sulfur cluster assembly protein